MGNSLQITRKSSNHYEVVVMHGNSDASLKAVSGQLGDAANPMNAGSELPGGPGPGNPPFQLFMNGILYYSEGGRLFRNVNGNRISVTSQTELTAFDRYFSSVYPQTVFDPTDGRYHGGGIEQIPGILIGALPSANNIPPGQAPGGPRPAPNSQLHFDRLRFKYLLHYWRFVVCRATCSTLVKNGLPCVFLRTKHGKPQKEKKRCSSIASFRPN